jgi:hypothetical protein
VLTIDGGIAIDPTHPGFKQMTAYYLNDFESRRSDYLILDFIRMARWRAWDDILTSSQEER